MQQKGSMEYLCQDLIFRKLYNNIKRIYGVEQANRNQIVKQIVPLLKEESPKWVVRLDVRRYGEYGEKKDKELAKKYLIKAAELNDAWGCLNLGTQYYLGNYLMDKSYSQAFVYVKKAADMGLIDACNVLAYFYENGIGCDKNPQKAKEYKDRTVVKD